MILEYVRHKWIGAKTSNKKHEHAQTHTAFACSRPHIWFVWSMRRSTLLQHCRERVAKFARLGADCQLFVTREEYVSSSNPRDASDDSVTVNAGRPKLCAVFRSVAAHYELHHQTHLNSRGQIGCALLCCGPASLVRAAKESAVAQSSAMSVDLHEEVFEF